MLLFYQVVQRAKLYKFAATKVDVLLRIINTIKTL